MADYTIPTYPMRRLRYYNNQFLNEKDFIDDQADHIARLRAPMRALCIAGVCEGLTVRLDATKKLQVAAGLAVDRSGNVIALDAEKPGPDAQNLADGSYALHIAFAEEESDPANPPAGGAPGMTRWHQAPALGATRTGTAVPAAAIVLGSFTVAAGAVTGTTGAGRQWSGVRLPGLTAAPPTLVNDGDGAGDGAQLTGDLTLRRDTGAGKLGPTLALVNGAAYPGGAGAGAAIDFSGYDPAGNQPSLRIQSLGDNQGSSHLVISTKQPGTQPGAITNALVERLRLTSFGTLQFPNVSQDKLNLADGYGIAINPSNLALYCPPAGHLSLRQGTVTGTEVFTVSGAGAASFLGGGTFGGAVGVTGNVTATGTVSWGDADTRSETRNDAGLQGNAGGRSGFYQTQNPVNFPPGASSWWHLLDVRHSNTTNIYALQVAGSFFNQDLWYRKTNNNPAAAWRQFVTADAAGVIAGLSVNGDIVMYGKLAVRGSDTWLRLNDAQAFPSGTNVNGLFRVDGDVQLRGKLAVRGSDAWLRLNDTREFTSGTSINGGLWVERFVRVDGDLQMSAKVALRGSDTWLRLNADGQFTSGVYTPGVLRVDGGIELAGKNAMRSIDGWLRINDLGDFPSGVRTRGVHLTDSLNVGGLNNAGDPGQGSVWIARTLGVYGNIGTHDYPPDSDMPAGWGGGVNTWDVVAHGTLWAVHGAKSGNFDVAEKFAHHEAGLEPGDVVAVDPRQPERLIRSPGARHDHLVGVVSEKPGFELGVSWETPESGVALALAGRVPVKVNLEGGEIAIGDYLTSSAQPGIAMRAIRSGRVVGMAMQAFDGRAGGEGKIVMFVNPHWFGGR